MSCSLCIYQILKIPPVRFDPKTLCVPAYSGTVVYLFFESVSSEILSCVLQKVWRIYGLYGHWP